ncbi:MAG: PilZ domain-containing protein [Cyanobium sp. M30B3]|nr:MAG: PilZ domain-containing protein [Cyanobium sp. M30B3]
MAPAGSDPGAGPGGPDTPAQLPPLPPPPPFEAASILAAPDQRSAHAAGSGQDGRRHPREQAPLCRPLTVLLPSAGCCTADILDISLGGLCLLITHNQELRIGQAVTVDFSAHRLPAAMQSGGLVEARLRWYVRSGPVTTMGVGFDVPLPALPELL